MECSLTDSILVNEESEVKNILGGIHMFKLEIHLRMTLKFWREAGLFVVHASRVDGIIITVKFEPIIRAQLTHHVHIFY
jgi:hypothetical protein